MNDPKHDKAQRDVSPGSGPGRRLAQFLAEGRPEEVPEHIRHEAKRAILHYFGTELGGSRDAEIERGFKVLGAFSGPRNGTLIGRCERVDCRAGRERFTTPPRRGVRRRGP